MIKKYILNIFVLAFSIVQAQEFSIREMPNLINVQYSSVAFADVNGDGNADLLLCGADGGYALRSSLYLNDGQGNFSLSDNPDLMVIREGAAAFADIDGDGDQDLLITGITEVVTPAGNYGTRVKLYRNNGTGLFSEIANPGLEAVSQSAVLFQDIDNDGDVDLLMAGQGGGAGTTNLYVNDGSGNFTLANANIPAKINLIYATIAMADIDNDGDPDLLLTGMDGSDNQIRMALYKNNGSGVFTKVNNPGIEPIFTGGAVFEDVDNDGDMDLMMMGADPLYAKVAKLYLNDGSGNFTLKANTPFIGAQYGDVKFAEVNNDGLKDVLITGYRNPNMRADLYINNGNAEFTMATDMPFIGMNNSAFAFADVDNDADMDLVIAGQNSPLGTLTKLYINQTNMLSVANPQMATVKLYPNPTHHSINVEIPVGTMVEKIEVYDNLGKLVVQQQSGQTLSVEKLPTALYMAVIYTDKGILRQKIAKY
ncbi:T9SS type A sorting domain-containing protein [Flavobacterium supellecticarium]|uniref:T9SS type A sorting domain-containing protein n=1 Tax=Flavobacterium supellecticarium TaxID=2565924 RepID=A0A4S3ZYQ4_9FLAO|nr:T9SS type A sorting domain-containing protein [Flavobacterium supellecticarium]